MKFKELKKGSIKEVESEILSIWKKDDILNKTIENRKDSENFVFYDGPATANGKPGIHHMLAKELKDTFCKYKTMQGFRVLRKVGWDTHGLPVEVQVEKQLGFSGKKDIEDYGIEKFNQKCRESVWENEAAFKDLTEQMGQFIDLDNPYITYNNDYIETEWWILKKYYDEGLIYNGYKITPYCPRCGTSLSSHEVAQEYKEISVNTVTVPLKVKTLENTYILVWTTTPWTLIANVAACVNPTEKYIKAESKGYNFIVAKKLASKVLGEEYKVLEEYNGKDLEGLEYEQLMPFIDIDKKAFYVTCADYVTMEDGTGIVHIAPAFGQDDYEVGKKYDLPIINPVGEDGKYLKGPWEGRLVVDPELEIDIIKYLHDNDKLFKKQKIVHNYPHCWRCKTPLLYYAKPSWYIKTTAYKDKIIEANNKVNWYPSYVGEKRFANWLENMIDWGISRNRYWGTPLPIWTCDCGHIEVIGSKKELIEKSITKIDEDIELHRPYVDNIHIKCSCGKEMNRVPDVLDCWFDSGSMPFAQYHYPFENKELFESQFPADFIAEGVDQTRGWFYTLLVISSFVMGKSSYKNVLVNDLLLDKYGHKMHKSRGNAIEPFSIMDEYGADTIRFYLPYVSPVWTPIKFDIDGLKEIYSKYISTFKNTYSFFQMYANADDIDPREYNILVSEREITDKWLLSKMHKLLEKVTEAYESYDLTTVVRNVVTFLNDDLSNWYIRSNRRRFWESELTLSKKSVYLTTYEVLVNLCLITAPITPFISEEIYQNLTGEASVHLANFPKYDRRLIDEKIEERMDLVRDICSLGRFAREDAKIKVRQPISEIILHSSNENIIGDLTSIIKEELNVKNILFISDMTKYMNYIIKPNFREVGKILGSKVNAFATVLSKLTTEEIEKIKEGSFEIDFEGEKLVITPDMVEIKINVKEGFYSSSDSKNFVILNTELTENLILEGIAREIVRKVQSIRKDMDLVITDRINIYYNGNDMIDKTIKQFSDFIKNETLTLEIKNDKSIAEKCIINDNEMSIMIEKK